jgi:hypothetical protein
MAFNITSWSQEGRDFGRGAPPPKGSLEYIAVGSMWTAEPPRRKRAASTAGAEGENLSFTEIDAADKWLTNIHRSLVYARKVHGDKIITKTDVADWDEFISRWNPLRDNMNDLHVLFRSAADRQNFQSLLNESKVLYDRFVAKGMAPIPVPYAAELVTLLRTMPKKITAAQMFAKLQAGIQCGDKLLDDKTPWYAWKKSGNTKPLAVAIDNARAMGAILARSTSSKETYGSGEPVYDEFLRRLTRIWIEAAGLYGIEETRRTAKAELKDDLKRRATEETPSNILWLLVTAGVGFLGIKWITGRSDKPKVAVPDAYRDVRHDSHQG